MTKELTLTERLRAPVGMSLIDGMAFKKGEPLHDSVRLEAADEIERLRADNAKIKAALNELLEQIDLLDGIEYSRDTDRYKAEASWDDVVDRAREAAR